MDVPALLGQSAQRLSGRLHGIQQTFQEKSDSPSTWLWFVLVLAGAVVLLFTAGILQELQRRRKAPPARKPHVLFRSVVKRLRLSWTQRRLLQAIAGEVRLKHPMGMLLSPGLLSRHAHRWAAGKPLRARVMGLRKVDVLCRKLFGVPLPSEPKTPARGA